MLNKNEGCILFTGATSPVRAGAISFSSAKFATRGLAHALARELWTKGIHVAGFRRQSRSKIQEVGARVTAQFHFVNGIPVFFRASTTVINLFFRETFMPLAPAAAFAYNRSVRDFLFIDAVSGKPLRREDKGFVPRGEERVRRSTLRAILVALIGVIMSLVWWGFS